MIDSNVKLLGKQIEEFEEKIQVEKRRVEQFSQAKRDETNRQLQKAQSDLTQAERRMRELQTRRADLKAEAEAAQADSTKLNGNLAAVRQDIQNFKDQLGRCTAQESNKLACFGTHMDKVLADIDRTQWYGSKPLGPIGLYVKVRQPEKWANLMRVQIGSQMSSFIIADGRDRSQLDGILKKYNKYVLFSLTTKSHHLMFTNLQQKHQYYCRSTR